MKQNKYDDPQFFAGYAEMARSKGGLAAAGEWPVLQAMLPPLAGKRVLDLGCGYGWHCRYAREEGATAVLGVDISEKMLERAREMTSDPAITYQRAALEDLDLADGSFDVVISSLTLHYIEGIDAIFGKLHKWLTQGGVVVLSVEHPIYTARAEQDWHYGPDGSRMHWPLDAYQDEGLRRTSWFTDNVVKYHRTVATWINALIAAGFTITEVAEPQPTQEAMERDPQMRDESRRPMFLLMRATKT
jgi:SAM-dependent methyltransferase